MILEQSISRAGIVWPDTRLSETLSYINAKNLLNTKKMLSSFNDPFLAGMLKLHHFIKYSITKMFVFTGQISQIWRGRELVFRVHMWEWFLRREWVNNISQRVWAEQCDSYWDRPSVNSHGKKKVHVFFSPESLMRHNNPHCLKHTHHCFNPKVSS